LDPTPDELRTFVGPRADYYLARWGRIAQGASRALGFNAAAFFLTLFWLLFRRMYRVFWIAVGLITASAVLEEIVLAAAGLKEAPLLDLLMSVIVAATFGTYGTYWYYQHTRRQFARLAAGSSTDREMVRRVGGTSWFAVGLGAAAFIGLMILGAWASTLPQ